MVEQPKQTLNSLTPFRMPADEKEALRRLARAYGITVSDTLRRLYREPLAAALKALDDTTLPTVPTKKNAKMRANHPGV